MTADAPDLTPGRRIRAAMQLAGIESFGELARIVDTRNLGERTLRKIADDSDQSRNLQRLDAVAIAEATGLPVSFFVAPADALLDAIAAADEAGAKSDQRDELEARLATVEENLLELTRAVAAGALGRAAKAAAEHPDSSEGQAGTGRRRGRAGGASR